LKKLLKKLFLGRDKRETIGIWMGTLCFIPTSLIVIWLSAFKNIILGIAVLIITQTLWLTSIKLCMASLEMENERLKEEIKKLKNHFKY
jgi:hypothetical protein